MPRQQKRVPYLIETFLQFASGKHEARLSDLSVGGCYIDSIAPVAQGEAVSFDIPLPEGRLLHATGTVTYVLEGNGFGVKFAEMSKEDQMRILHFIRASEDR